jgi:hypothetical protein
MENPKNPKDPGPDLSARDRQRQRHVQYLDDQWQGRGWIPEDVRNRRSFPHQQISLHAISNLVSITKLCIQSRIALDTLWQPGGILHEVVSADNGIFVKEHSSIALKRLKERTGLDTVSGAKSGSQPRGGTGEVNDMDGDDDMGFINDEDADDTLVNIDHEPGASLTTPPLGPKEHLAAGAKRTRPDGDRNIGNDKGCKQRKRESLLPLNFDLGAGFEVVKAQRDKADM